MKRAIFLLFTVFLLGGQLLAQYSPCYQAAFAEGKKYYNAGNYAKAKTSFNEAKSCPDPNTTEINDWIGKCDKAIAEAAQKAKEDLAVKQKREKDAKKNAYMSIKRMDYCNVYNSGNMIDDYGATFYQSRMKCLQPRITYNALLGEQRATSVNVKIINPNGALVTGKDSPSGYTYSASLEVAPGKDKTIELPKWDNNGVSYTIGTYKLELWHNDRRLFSSSFAIEEDPEEPEPEIIYVTERKAEIVVFGNDGKPLEGAKILLVSTGKSEWTNSDGLGRIDMSDSDSKKVEVSHSDYKDKQEITLHVGDAKNVWLYEPKSGASTALYYAKCAVPGLMQWQNGNVIEGAAIAGGEVVLLAGGLISNSIAKNQLKVMQNDNVTLADFQSARKKYKAQRAVNVICYTSAALLYGFHLYRVFTLPGNGKTGKRMSMSPAVMSADSEMAIGMSINVTF